MTLDTFLPEKPKLAVRCADCKKILDEKEDRCTLTDKGKTGVYCRDCWRKRLPKRNTTERSTTDDDELEEEDH